VMWQRSVPRSTGAKSSEAPDLGCDACVVPERDSARACASSHGGDAWSAPGVGGRTTARDCSRNLVTCGAVAPGPDDAVKDLARAPLWGCFGVRAAIFLTDCCASSTSTPCPQGPKRSKGCSRLTRSLSSRCVEVLLVAPRFAVADDKASTFVHLSLVATAYRHRVQEALENFAGADAEAARGAGSGPGAHRGAGLPA
jgi:hypothetical protein